MKKKDLQNIRNESVDELMKKADELAVQLAAIKINKYTKQSKNLREYKIIRQKRAAILTIVREKELRS